MGFAPSAAYLGRHRRGDRVGVRREKVGQFRQDAKAMIDIIVPTGHAERRVGRGQRGLDLIGGRLRIVLHALLGEGVDAWYG